MSGTICKFSCVKLGRLQDSTRLLLFEGRDRIGFSFRELSGAGPK